MNEQIKQKIIDAINSGKKVDDLAKALFMSSHQLRILLKSWGVEFQKKRKSVEKPSRDDLMKWYNEFGSSHETSQHYGVGVNTIMRWMKEYAIPPRKMANMSDEQKAQYLEQHLQNLKDIDL